MTMKNKNIIDTSKIKSICSELTEQDIIKQGIENLLEKRLNEIEKAINSKGDFLEVFAEETVLYNAVKKIAIKEGVSTLEYDKRKEKLKLDYYKAVIRRYG